MTVDRNLLFGLLALQNGVINQAELVLGFQAWTLDKSRCLADHLEARGDLTRAKRTLLEGLVEVRLEAHGGLVEQSLASVSAGHSTRESLAKLGDPDIGRTLAHIGSASSQHDADHDRTATYSVGTTTSDGLRFRILRPHARGGLGAVFVALDTESHREVALKQMLDHHADEPTSRGRFLAEAEITGGLEHLPSEALSEMPRRRRSRSELVFLCLALGCGLLGCRGDAPGNPMPPVEATTGAEFVYGPDTEAETARRVRIPGERVGELHRLFDGSRLDPEPARWAEKGKLKLFLKGGGIETYDIYWTGKDPGAYADHLRRYFRGGSDAAFAKFLNEVEQIETKR